MVHMQVFSYSSMSRVFCIVDSVPRADCNDGNDDQNASSVFPAFPLQHSKQYNN